MAKGTFLNIVIVFSITGETGPAKLKCLCERMASPWEWGLKAFIGDLFKMRYFCGTTACAHLTQNFDCEHVVQK